MALTGTMRVRADFDQIENVSSIEAWPARFNPVLNHLHSLTSGTGQDQADIFYFSERTVASATNDDIDLVGSLADIYGDTVSPAEIVGFFVINQQADGTANTTNLTIGAGSNPWQGWIEGTTKTIAPIRPGGIFAIYNPDGDGAWGNLAAGTADILRIANSSGASNTYVFGLIARSA